MTHLGDNIIAFFKKAVNQVEELQVQTALGKSELSDKLEALKKETKEKINHFKWDLSADLSEGKEAFQHLKAKIEHLELQVALGKAETEEELHEQKKNLSTAIKDVRNLISKD